MSKRATLSGFAPAPITAQADAGQVIQDQPAQASAAAALAPAKSKRPSSVTVYLTPEEVRTLKLIGIDHGQKITDICAAAIRDWLERNGHARGKVFKA